MSRLHWHLPSSSHDAFVHAIPWLIRAAALLAFALAAWATFVDFTQV